MMDAARLKTGILGLTESGLRLAAAAVETGLFEIVTAADRDADILQTVMARYGCSGFEDYRQLIIQNQLDVLIVAAGLHFCDDHVKLALKRRFHVLKVAPPGLNFSQAAELSGLAESEGVQYTIANATRSCPGFQLLKEYLEANDRGRIRLVTASCYLPGLLDEVRDRWLTDPQLAGGGVLLRNCYELVDQLVLNFGIPQKVYALCTNQAPDRQQRLSLTEDTAVVTMKYSDTLMVNLIATRTFGPPQCEIRLHHAEGYVTAAPDSFTVCDNAGKVLKRSSFQDVEAGSVLRMLTDFALSVTTPDKQKAQARRGIDLDNMAVIEAAYLSARTAMPEEPQRILEIVGSEPANIWTSAAKRII
ncbi:MAG TPA: Gfo/Idh/MocA family oxidoreductase [Anaerohalosphaeraceae bacterium]|mgnify:CR=1 FL=1|jgi:predicted dehydrogenase|nr:Gfo/Idh/MocA family oxidoreductase [Anaerohalosphaeraceae bacterium]